MSSAERYLLRKDARLEFAPGLHGMCGVANALIPSGTPLLSLSHANILSERYAVENKLGQALGAACAAAGLPAVPPRIRLYATMLAEAADADAPFHQYLTSLPKVMDDPLWWTGSELAEIAGSNMETARDAKQSWLHGEHDRLFSLGPLVEVLAAFKVPTSDSLARFLWAHSAFASRAFPHELSEPPGAAGATVPAGSDDDHGEAGFVGCLLPGLDILNHGYRTRISWVCGVDSLEFVAEQDFAAGAEVCNNYGPKASEELLLSYGFVLPGNPQDFFALRVGLGGGSGKALSGGGSEAGCGTGAPVAAGAGAGACGDASDTDSSSGGGTDEDEEDNAAPLAAVMKAAELPLRHEVRRLLQKDAVAMAAAGVGATTACEVLYRGGVIPTSLLQALRLSAQPAVVLRRLLREGASAQREGSSEAAGTQHVSLSQRISRPLCYCSELRALRALRGLLQRQLVRIAGLHRWVLSDNSSAGSRATHVDSSVGAGALGHRVAMAREYIGSQAEILCDAMQLLDAAMAALPFWWHGQRRCGDAVPPTTLVDAGTGASAATIAADKASCATAASDVCPLSAEYFVTASMPAGSPVATLPLDAAFCRSNLLRAAPELAEILNEVPGLELVEDDVDGDESDGSESTSDEDGAAQSPARLAPFDADKEELQLALFLVHTFGREPVAAGSTADSSAETSGGAMFLSRWVEWAARVFGSGVGGGGAGDSGDATAAPSSKRRRVEGADDTNCAAASTAASGRQAATESLPLTPPPFPACNLAMSFTASASTGNTMPTEEDEQRWSESYGDVVKPLIASFPKLFRKNLFTRRNWRWACAAVARCAVPAVLDGVQQLCILPLHPLPAGPSARGSAEGCSTVPSPTCAHGCFTDLQLRFCDSSRTLQLIAPRPIAASSEAPQQVFWNVPDAACAVLLESPAWPAAVVDGEGVRPEMLPADAERLAALRARVTHALQQQC